MNRVFPETAEQLGMRILQGMSLPFIALYCYSLLQIETPGNLTSCASTLSAEASRIGAPPVAPCRTEDRFFQGDEAIEMPTLLWIRAGVKRKLSVLDRDAFLEKLLGLGALTLEFPMIFLSFVCGLFGENFKC